MFHSSSVHTSIRRRYQIVHVLHFRLVDSLPNYAPDFVVNCRIEVRAVWRPQIWKFTWVTTILHFCSGGSEWRTEC